VARFDRTIPPGGEGSITLEVNTKSKQGNIHQTARVFTNDPKRSQLTIGIAGHVWTPVLLNPKYARLRGVLGEKTKTTIRLKSQKQDPLMLELVSVSIPEKVDVALKELEKGRVWELQVENKVHEQKNYSGHIKLKTNYPEKPDLNVRISGQIRPHIEARPKVINFGRISEDRVKQFKKKGTHVRRPVTVQLHKGTDLKVKNVDLEGWFYKVIEVKEIQPGKTYRIQIEALLEKLMKGKNTDKLKIYTNKKTAEVLEVPIYFEIL
jgi:hypothetical protein